MGSDEQRMKFVNFAVISLVFPVPKPSTKYGNSCNGLCIRELREIIRRSQSTVSKFPLLITLLAGKARETTESWPAPSGGDKRRPQPCGWGLLRGPRA